MILNIPVTDFLYNGDVSDERSVLFTTPLTQAPCSQNAIFCDVLSDMIIALIAILINFGSSREWIILYFYLFDSTSTS